ncbi:80 kD MCM3-associated protein [Ophiocordyceps camponoti-floridani]|uniref:80 kD MCM3-associated protein n=1 Tax=Ophiocordyceps camponoti-floridani TaxID=2030778 RepID=A0A8H4Q4X6_9HYPO|nr:80 kD MCM3-associated protein [Ophiocordyceps camponoti-floridani]
MFSSHAEATRKATANPFASNEPNPFSNENKAKQTSSDANRDSSPRNTGDVAKQRSGGRGRANWRGHHDNRGRSRHRSEPRNPFTQRTPQASAEEASLSRPFATDSTLMPPPNSSACDLAQRIYQRLQADGINPPRWPSDPISVGSQHEMSRFRESYEAYRSKARACLTKAGLIDDPEKRKKLSDALEFKGICEDMCPEYEKITRLTEHDVNKPEKDRDTGVVRVDRMVKKLARSAAGQEAPLPMDVRSAACLRRTLDYLIDIVLRRDNNLSSAHGFLWDRTRAIRRDFAFFSSMSEKEIKAQVYVLENITRFHVTSLHLLSRGEKKDDNFVEQQELEQLGKTLLSLRDVYDDCKLQGVTCENEAEFRAYYLLFHGRDSGILETLQRQWRPSLWQESDEIRTAVSLIEALQSTQEFIGSRKDGHAGPLLASSGAHLTYFRIVEDPKVSYTMACFAECHFQDVRRSLLATVKRALARPKDPVRDVTAASLNEFLRFDTVEQAIEFANMHNLRFEPDQQFPTDIARQLLVLNDKLTLPHVRLEHQFSQSLVERKRGTASLPDVIHSTVFEGVNDTRAYGVGRTRNESMEGEKASEAAAEKNTMAAQARKSGFANSGFLDSDTEEDETAVAAPAAPKNPFAPVNQEDSTNITKLPTLEELRAQEKGHFLRDRPKPHAFSATDPTQPPKSNPFGSPLEVPDNSTLKSGGFETVKPNPFAPTSVPANGEGLQSAAAAGFETARANPFANEEGLSMAPPGGFETAKPNPFAPTSESANGEASLSAPFMIEPLTSPFQQPVYTTFKFGMAKPNPFAPGSVSANGDDLSLMPVKAIPSFSPSLPTYSTVKIGSAKPNPFAPASLPVDAAGLSSAPVNTNTFGGPVQLGGGSQFGAPSQVGLQAAANQSSSLVRTQQSQLSSFSEPVETGPSFAASKPDELSTAVASSEPSAAFSFDRGQSSLQNASPVVAPGGHHNVAPSFAASAAAPLTNIQNMASVPEHRRATDGSANWQAASQILGPPQTGFVPNNQVTSVHQTTDAQGQPVPEGPMIHDTNQPTENAIEAPAAAQPAPVAEEPVPPERDLMADFNKWYVNGDQGLMSDFLIHTVIEMTQRAFETFHLEEAERKDREEEEKREAEAKEFRVYKISVKYLRLWRIFARRKRLNTVARTGRDLMRAHIQQRLIDQRDERRAKAKAAAEAEKLKDEHSKQMADHIVKLARAQGKARREAKQKASDALLATGVLSGLDREKQAAKRIVAEDEDSVDERQSAELGGSAGSSSTKLKASYGSRITNFKAMDMSRSRNVKSLPGSSRPAGLAASDSPQPTKVASSTGPRRTDSRSSDDQQWSKLKPSTSLSSSVGKRPTNFSYLEKKSASRSSTDKTLMPPPLPKNDDSNSSAQQDADATRSRHSQPSTSSSSDRSNRPFANLSTYWRLKALGLVELPDGKVLPESLASHNFSEPGPEMSLEQVIARKEAILARMDALSEAGRADRARAEPMLREARARIQRLQQSQSTSKKRKYAADDDDDDDLDDDDDDDDEDAKIAATNARLRDTLATTDRILEQQRANQRELEEGIAWFRANREMLESEERASGGAEGTSS